jgi:hypothetical protein
MHSFVYLSNQIWLLDSSCALFSDFIFKRIESEPENKQNPLFCFSFLLSFTGSLQIKKVKLDAKLEHEYINNFKLLQNAMKKVLIEKVDQN